MQTGYISIRAFPKKSQLLFDFRKKKSNVTIMNLRRYIVNFVFVNLLLFDNAEAIGFMMAFKSFVLPVLLGTTLDVVSKIWPASGEITSSIASFLGVGKGGRSRRDADPEFSIDMEQVNRMTHKLINILERKGVTIGSKYC